MTSYLQAMKQYFDFSGRATRSQYWIFILVMMAIWIAALILDGVIGNLDDGTDFPLITILLITFHYIPSLAVGARRLHDTGKTGWWQLVNIFPPGFILLIVFFSIESQPGDNQFGPNPHGIAGPRQDAYRPTHSAPPNVLDQIEKLADLRKSGAISEEEFQRMKAEEIRKAG